MLNLRSRFGQLVARSRSRPQRLRVPVERLPAGSYRVAGNWSITHGDAYDVLRLFYGYIERAPGGLGPHRIESTGTVGGPVTRVVSRLGPAGEGGHNETSA